MFTINQVATIYVYMEYIIPIIIIILIFLYLILKSYKTQWKVKKINKQHIVEKRSDSIFWDAYYCTKCNQLLYKQPTDINTSFSKNDYIFYSINKCIKD